MTAVILRRVDLVAPVAVSVRSSPIDSPADEADVIDKDREREQHANCDCADADVREPCVVVSGLEAEVVLRREDPGCFELARGRTPRGVDEPLP